MPRGRIANESDVRTLQDLEVEIARTTAEFRSMLAREDAAGARGAAAKLLAAHNGFYEALADVLDEYEWYGPNPGSALQVRKIDDIHKKAWPTVFGR